MRAGQTSWDAGTAQERGIIAPEELVSGSTTQDRHLDALGAVFTAIHRPQHGSLSLESGPRLVMRHGLRPVLSLRSLFGCFERYPWPVSFYVGQ